MMGLMMWERYLCRLEVFPVVVHGGDLRPQLGYHYLDLRWSVARKQCRTHHHDPDQKESVGGQQCHDGQLVGVEVDVVLRHEGAGEDSLKSVRS